MHIYIYIYIYIYICMCMCVYMCMCVCEFVNIYKLLNTKPVNIILFHIKSYISYIHILSYYTVIIINTN